MLKRLLLMTATFAVIGVLFLAYHLSTGGAADGGPTTAENLPDLTALKLPEADPDEETVLTPKVGGVDIGAGSKTWVTWYDERTGKAKLQFRAEEWEPIGEREFSMADLQVRMMMPGGQVVEIHADEGQVLMSHGELSDAAFRRGWVRKNVRVIIDRSRPEWREQNPELRDMDLRPEQVVRVWTDELHFDLELSRIQTEEAFRLESFEADLEGRGLMLRWNDDDGRIEYLEITHGKALTLRGSDSAIDFNLLGGSTGIARAPENEAVAEAKEETIDVENLPEARAEVKEPSVVDPELLVLDLSPNDEPEPQVTYRARFSEAVRVEQHRGEEIAGRLIADQLALLFDASQLEKATATPPGGGGSKSETERAEAVSEAEDEEDESDGSGDVLTLTWAGPLIVEPETEPAAEDSERRLHVEATGRPVHIEDGQGSADCLELDYHDETGRLWLMGSKDSPVVLTSGPERQIRTEQLFYDHGEHVARLEGPGSMIGGSSGLSRSESVPAQGDDAGDEENQTEIRWSKSVALHIAETEFENVDPTTGLKSMRRTNWIERAVLDGDVSLRQSDQLVRADRTVVEFSSPDKPGRTISDIRQFEGTGGVQMLRGEDDIRCDRMVVEMTTTADDRNAPTEARAYGRVVASQRRRSIRASEQMTVRMKQASRPQTEVTVEQARVIARARGIDPDEVDWGAWAARQAARTETVIAAVDARGEVRIDDPDRELRVRSERVECSIDDAGQIERATVSSQPGELSEVEMTDFGIRGRIIELDASEPWALVPGPGRVRFFTDQGMDGGSLDEPIPVDIAWQGRMELKGLSNELVFEQEVQTRSTDEDEQKYELDCNTLAVHFVDLPMPVEAPGDESVALNYWVFEPLVRAASRSKQAPLIGGGGGQAQFRKKPIELLADGDALAVVSSFDPTGNRLESRMRIEGPRIAVDLRRQSHNVEGVGSLLIEDYRIPDARERRRRSRSREQSESMLGGLAGGGPSQTLFTWENSMSYLAPRNIAIFDRNVQMVHRAGAEMVMGKELAAAQELDVAELQKLRGRRTQLVCDNLLTEFASGTKRGGSSGMMGRDGTFELALIKAAGSITLRDGSKTVVGDRLNYSRAADLVTIHAQMGQEAHIYDEDSKSGTLRAHWRGPELRWFLSDNRVEAAEASILLGGR